MRKLGAVTGLVVIFGVLLAACGNSSGPPRGNGPSGSTLQYVEAGFFIYDGAIQAVSSSLSSPASLRAGEPGASSVSGLARLERYLDPELSAQALPLGYKVQLSAFWRGATDAERYRVYLREVGGVQEEITSVSGNETHVTIDDVLPIFTILDGTSYEVGVAPVINGLTMTPTWSWPLKALGAVHLERPDAGSAQSERPSFSWTNAQGGPGAVELDIFDANGVIVDGGFWTGAPLPSSHTAQAQLPAGTYSWTVYNGSSSQAATDARTRNAFGLGYMVITVPGPRTFTVGGGGGGGGGDGGGGQPGAGGDISGTVNAPPGQALTGTLVVACYLVGEQCDDAKTAVFQVTASGSSAQFSFSGLAAGQYGVYAYKDSNGNQRFDDGDWYGEVEQTVTPPASGLVMNMGIMGGGNGGGGDGGGGGSGGSISGTVVAPTGGNVAGTLVLACYPAGEACDEGKSMMIQVAGNGSSGAFTFSGLAAGQYYLSAWNDANGNGNVDSGDHLGGLDDPVSPPASGVQIQLGVLP